jgi:hypothetical protein
VLPVDLPYAGAVMLTVIMLTAEANRICEEVVIIYLYLKTFGPQSALSPKEDINTISIIRSCCFEFETGNGGM